jgi:hypothetical protein
VLSRNDSARLTKSVLQKREEGACTHGVVVAAYVLCGWLVEAKTKQKKFFFGANSLPLPVLDGQFPKVLSHARTEI